MKTSESILRSTCWKIPKCPEVYQKMENGVIIHGGGIVQLMKQRKKKGDCGRSGKNGGSKEEYILAKRVAKQRVFAAKLKKKEWKILKLIHIFSTHIIYQRTKQIKQENKDIVIKKCIQDDNGLLAFNEEDKKKACK